MLLAPKFAVKSEDIRDVSPSSTLLRGLSVLSVKKLFVSETASVEAGVFVVGVMTRAPSPIEEPLAE
jgi:hypothetical protein